MDTDQAQSILNLAHSAFISMDEEGTILYWNIRAEEMFGLTREEAVGRVLADTVIPEQYHEAHWRGLRHFLQKGEGPVLDKRIELTAQRSDGSEFPVELMISALNEGDRWSFHAFIADISERQEAEQERLRLLDELRHALRGTEERLAVIVDALGEAVTIRGADDHLIHANRAALDRLGLETLRGRRLGLRMLVRGHDSPPSAGLVREGCHRPQPLVREGVDGLEKASPSAFPTLQKFLSGIVRIGHKFGIATAARFLAVRR